MVSTILILFLLISYAQAISTSDFQPSESRALKQSTVQTHQEFLEILWYGRSMKEKNRKNEISQTLRKAHGSGGRGSPSGSGSANINRRPYATRNSAASSNLSLSVASFAFIFVFLFN